jgi:hypothetical protein
VNFVPFVVDVFFDQMGNSMKARVLVVVSCSLLALAAGLAARQQNPFLGKWNLTGTGPDSAWVGWLEITQEGAELGGSFLNRGGAPAKLAGARVENGELVFQGAARRGGPGPEGHGRMQGSQMTVTIGVPATAAAPARTMTLIGVHPPQFPPSDANAPHTFGAPVELFDGKSLDAFTYLPPGQPWFIVDGLATNSPPTDPGRGRSVKGSNMVSKQKFQDYKIHAEYKLDDGSHSGIYFRGRYEMQIQGDMGTPPSPVSHMSVYGRVAPLVNPSIPDNEWNIMDGIIVGNRITVTLNGKKVHDNTMLPGITGNAIDADELAPGSVRIGGDDGKVWYRRVTVTPITDTKR